MAMSILQHVKKTTPTPMALLFLKPLCTVMAGE